jgi:hypothetical protein
MDDTDACELDALRAGFSVEIDDRDRWLVKERSGQIEGEFMTQAEALHFALVELDRGRVYPPEFAAEPRLQLVGHESDD